MLRSQSCAWQSIVTTPRFIVALCAVLLLLCLVASASPLVHFSGSDEDLRAACRDLNQKFGDLRTWAVRPREEPPIVPAEGWIGSFHKDQAVIRFKGTTQAMRGHHSMADRLGKMFFPLETMQSVIISPIMTGPSMAAYVASVMWVSKKGCSGRLLAMFEYTFIHDATNTLLPQPITVAISMDHNPSHFLTQILCRDDSNPLFPSPSPSPSPSPMAAGPTIPGTCGGEPNWARDFVGNMTRGELQRSAEETFHTYFIDKAHSSHGKEEEWMYVDAMVPFEQNKLDKLARKDVYDNLVFALGAEVTLWRNFLLETHNGCIGSGSEYLTFRFLWKRRKIESVVRLYDPPLKDIMGRLENCDNEREEPKGVDGHGKRVGWAPPR